MEPRALFWRLEAPVVSRLPSCRAYSTMARAAEALLQAKHGGMKLHDTAMDERLRGEREIKYFVLMIERDEVCGWLFDAIEEGRVYRWGGGRGGGGVGRGMGLGEG
jgi:hypothetical protein